MKATHAGCLSTKQNGIGFYAGCFLLLMLVLNVTNDVEKPVAQVICIAVFEAKQLGDMTAQGLFIFSATAARS